MPSLGTPDLDVVHVCEIVIAERVGKRSKLPVNARVFRSFGARFIGN